MEHEKNPYYGNLFKNLPPILQAKMPLWLHIAIGILPGVLVSFLGGDKYMYYKNKKFNKFINILNEL